MDKDWKSTPQEMRWVYANPAIIISVHSHFFEGILTSSSSLRMGATSFRRKRKTGIPTMYHCWVIVVTFRMTRTTRNISP
jgi:hypothetical protein